MHSQSALLTLRRLTLIANRVLKIINSKGYWIISVLYDFLKAFRLSPAGLRRDLQVIRIISTSIQTAMLQSFVCPVYVRPFYLSVTGSKLNFPSFQQLLSTAKSITPRIFWRRQAEWEMSSNTHTWSCCIATKCFTILYKCWLIFARQRDPLLSLEFCEPKYVYLSYINMFHNFLYTTKRPITFAAHPLPVLLHFCPVL